MPFFCITLYMYSMTKDFAFQKVHDDKKPVQMIRMSKTQYKTLSNKPNRGIYNRLVPVKHQLAKAWLNR